VNYSAPAKKLAPRLPTSAEPRQRDARHTDTPDPRSGCTPAALAPPQPLHPSGAAATRMETTMNTIVPLIFDDQALRVTDRDGQPWFVLADACAMLGIKNPTVAAKPLDDSEKAKVFIGQGSEATVVSLPGLLTLIVRCRGALKPGTAAYRVRKWVTSDVVPTIMRTGSYGAPVAPADLDDNATLRALLMGRMDRLDQLQPKADALDRLSDARGAINVTEAAKVLKTNRDELFKQLHAKGWIYRGQASGRWHCHADKERAGIVEQRTTRILNPHGPDKIGSTVLITPKGLAKLAELMGPRT
jgi:anti-repressor protein